MDQKARKILFDTYWPGHGWKLKGRSITTEDYEYALQAGLKFRSEFLSHNEVVARVIQFRNAVQVEAVTRAFLASLTSRRLNLRSALGSYATARHFPLHSPSSRSEMEFGTCVICGLYFDNTAKIEEDFNVLSFERHKWGGVRHASPLYCAFDLEQFLKEEKLEPTSEDVAIFTEILRIAQNLTPEARIGGLEKEIGKILKSNQAERQVLLEILGYCGILEDPKQPSYFFNYVHHSKRSVQPNERHYPVCWWRGEYGVNTLALRTYFPEITGN